ncbi:MAG: hypothetical protein NTZ65_00625 [Candidatus Berkelbacteria bacterium]|nr:hypothetical protein [Candidatus Berkelbacteria bacterium]
MNKVQTLLCRLIKESTDTKVAVDLIQKVCEDPDLVRAIFTGGFLPAITVLLCRIADGVKTSPLALGSYVASAQKVQDEVLACTYNKNDPLSAFVPIPLVFDLIRNLADAYSGHLRLV